MQKYVILRSSTEAQLSVEVNNNIEKGYVPAGGLSIGQTIGMEGTPIKSFYQAMYLVPKHECKKTVKEN